ncbi:unnamed protein product [Miscanthus lutarioriparius]|uniref:Glycosyltransferase N-terminal domain-containing protein n=1 Tax=Miscanthus lutarioriparius TaxID=422564 RepID=A0A811N9A8_9POAL|nr:unnamed protein product [Miscanthus lutarioriparius]
MDGVKRGMAMAMAAKWNGMKEAGGGDNRRRRNGRKWGGGGDNGGRSWLSDKPWEAEHSDHLWPVTWCSFCIGHQLSAVVPLVVKGIQMESIAVVTVPFPAQGHLNQLLHLSLQLTARGLPVHYAAPAALVRQARACVHGWDEATLSSVVFHELGISASHRRIVVVHDRINVYTGEEAFGLHCLAFLDVAHCASRKFVEYVAKRTRPTKAGERRRRKRGRSGEPAERIGEVRTPSSPGTRWLHRPPPPSSSSVPAATAPPQQRSQEQEQYLLLLPAHARGTRR